MTGLRVWLQPFVPDEKQSLVVRRWSLAKPSPSLPPRPFALADDERPRTNDGCYTLRRFGGRQPLCGIGVESFMFLTSMPAAAKARMADSRPEPGPLTRPSTLRTP